MDKRTLCRLCVVIATVAFTFACSDVIPPALQPEDDLWASQPNDRIVFMSRADTAEGELYVLDKGGAPSRLTNNDRHENNPALSPGGDRVAFHGGEEANPLTWEIYVLDLETGQENRLTHNNVLDGHPDWSPDGSRIVFASFRDEEGSPSGTADIYVMNSDGTDLQRITDSPWEDNDPEWSPDGMRIVFKSTRGTQTAAREEIFVMDADGSNVVRLTATEGWQSDHDPSWSPGGESVVFSRFEGARRWTDVADPDLLRDHWREFVPWSIYQVDLHGETARLTDTDHLCGLPVFSRDGSHILFLRLDFIIANDRLVGADHRLIFADVDSIPRGQLIPTDRHTPTLEYFDW